MRNRFFIKKIYSIELFFRTFMDKGIFESVMEIPPNTVAEPPVIQGLSGS